MKTVGIVKTLFTCTLILVPMASYAQSKGQASEKTHHMWADLGLSADQSVKLKLLHQEIKTIRSKNFEAVRNVRAKIKEELAKPNSSTDQLDAYASELGNLHSEMVRQHNYHLLKVKTILSAEQFSKLISNEGERQGQHWRKGDDRSYGEQCDKSLNGRREKMQTRQTHPGCPHTED